MTKFQMPFSETNAVVSALVITPAGQGIQSTLSQQAKNEPVYDGVKIDQLRALHDVSHYDPIDRVGVASKKLESIMNDYQKSDLHKAFSSVRNKLKK